MLRVTSQAVTSEKSTANALSASIMSRAVAYSASTRAPVMAVAVIVTLVTGLDYVVRAVKLRQTSERADMKRRRRAERA